MKSKLSLRHNFALCLFCGGNYRFRSIITNCLEYKFSLKLCSKISKGKAKKAHASLKYKNTRKQKLKQIQRK